MPQLELSQNTTLSTKTKTKKKFLAANLELICQKVDKNIDQDMKEEFHEFFKGYKRIVIKKVGNAKVDT